MTLTCESPQPLECAAQHRANHEPARVQVRSDLLDGIDTLSDQDKLRLGRTIEGLMYGAVQSFLWNAILLFAVALTLLNFLSGDR